MERRIPRPVCDLHRCLHGQQRRGHRQHAPPNSEHERRGERRLLLVCQLAPFDVMLRQPCKHIAFAGCLTDDRGQLSLRRRWLFCRCGSQHLSPDYSTRAAASVLEQARVCSCFTKAGYACATTTWRALASSLVANLDPGEHPPGSCAITGSCWAEPAASIAGASPDVCSLVAR